MRRAGRLTATIAGVTVALAVLASSANALSGSIEGVSVEPSLASASVQNLSVNYDRCAIAGDPTCSWEARAWLTAPPETGCPPNGSWLLLILGHPPGMPPPPPSEQPWLGTRQIWRLESTGDGTLQSGPLQLNLEGVNDQHLCLYATEPPALSTNTVSNGAQASYTAEPERAPLLASQLLHVDQPLTTPPGPPVVHKVTCKKGFRRIKSHGKTICKRIKHRQRSHRTCGPPKAKTLLAGRPARIYSLPATKASETERIYGCLASTGRSVKLSPIPKPGSRWGAAAMSKPFVLSGSWAAGSEWQQVGRDATRLSVTARNLRSQQSKHCNVGFKAPGSRGVGMTSISLTNNGSLAWSGRGQFGSTAGRRPVAEIVACEGTGKRLLDSGKGIDLHSLALHGSTLTWTDAGVTRTARLR